MNIQVKEIKTDKPIYEKQVEEIPSEKDEVIKLPQIEEVDELVDNADKFEEVEKIEEECKPVKKNKLFGNISSPKLQQSQDNQSNNNIKYVAMGAMVLGLVTRLM